MCANGELLRNGDRLPNITATGGCLAYYGGVCWSTPIDIWASRGLVNYPWSLDLLISLTGGQKTRLNLGQTVGDDQKSFRWKIPVTHIITAITISHLDVWFIYIDVVFCNCCSSRIQIVEICRPDWCNCNLPLYYHQLVSDGTRSVDRFCYMFFERIFVN